jgi:hypothetical protein
MHRSVSGIDVHPTLPMTYRTGNNALQRLGELAGYRHSIKYYCFRRWIANTANSKSIALIASPFFAS